VINITRINKSMTSKQVNYDLHVEAIRGFAKMWNIGATTAEMAQKASVKEAEVYNLLNRIKAVARLLEDD
jgi:hypothetical protein